MITLLEAAGNIQRFEEDSLRTRVAILENRFQGANKVACTSLSSALNISTELLASAFVLKQAVGQINVVIHAVGILLSLPYILQPNEVIEELSLGAGNTGKPFDLTTNFRIAEFKFTRWRGGPEPNRKKELFKDFYWLAESDTTKQKNLYVVDQR